VREVDGGSRIVVEGLEAVRSDWTSLARDFQRELLRRVFVDEPWEAWIRETVAAGRRRGAAPSRHERRGHPPTRDFACSDVGTCPVEVAVRTADDYRSPMPRPHRTTPAAYRPWMNAILYQCVWFVGVLGREPLAPIAFALLALHLALCRERGAELALLAAAAALGVAIDSMLTLAGVFVFDPTATVLPIPAWLVAIWLAFAATLRNALRFLLSRLPLAIVAGAVGGPLSYLAAARLGAVSLPLGTWPTAAVLALVWAFTMPALIMLARAIERRAREEAPA